MPGPGGELQDRIDVHWRAVWRLPEVPVILLDASLEPRIAHKFLPRLRVERIASRRNAEIIQVTDTACSMNRLLSYPAADRGDQARAANRLAEVRTVAEAEASPQRKVALVTYKQAAERLGTIPGVDILHLGGLRGLDALKDHDAIIVAGRLQPGPEAVEAAARSLFGDEAELLQLPGGYVTKPRGYRCRDGHHRGVCVQVHPDPRAQSRPRAEPRTRGRAGHRPSAADPSPPSRQGDPDDPSPARPHRRSPDQLAAGSADPMVAYRSGTWRLPAAQPERALQAIARGVGDAAGRGVLAATATAERVRKTQ